MQLTNMTYEIENEVQRTTAILNTINTFTALTLVFLFVVTLEQKLVFLLNLNLNLIIHLWD
jgi:hypothetical protein